MKKPLKVLWVGDAGCKSGFARVTHAILDRLQATGEFDIAVLGINFHGWPDERRPYRMYPAAIPTPGDVDYFGKIRLRDIWEKEKPDVVVLFQDFWNIAAYIQNVPEMTGIVAYFPVDSPNVKPTWAIYLAKAAVVATYTNFAAKEVAEAFSRAWAEVETIARENGKTTLQHIFGADAEGKRKIKLSVNRIKQLRDPKFIKVIPHGIDQGKFYPIDMTEARQRCGIEEDAFVVLYVGRNQPRKRIDRAMEGFAKFAKNKPEARLVIHCWSNTTYGPVWDLKDLASYYGIRDKVILFHETHPTLTDEELNALYNCADVGLNTAGGEGWGLPIFECAACRKPQILPDWAATGELWRGAALLTRPIAFTHEVSMINTKQCIVDTDHLAVQLKQLYESPELRAELGERAFAVTQRPAYAWEQIAADFGRLIKQAAQVKEPKFEAAKVA